MNVAVTLASDIDPAYAAAYKTAVTAGVEVICIGTKSLTKHVRGIG